MLRYFYLFCWTQVEIKLKSNSPLLHFPFKRIPRNFNVPWNIPVYVQYIAEFSILFLIFAFLHRAFPWQLLVQARKGRKEPNVAIVDRRKQRGMSTWWDTGTYLDITPSCLWVLQLKRGRSCGREARKGPESAGIFVTEFQDRGEKIVEEEEIHSRQKSSGSARSFSLPSP